MPNISTTDAVNGTATDASLVNNNFTNVKNVVNGALDNSNISASAAIAVSKLATSTNGFALQVSGGVPTWAALPVVSYGTALPGSPTDGQEYVLVDSTTNPTYQWRFRWNAGSALSDKWEFVGGPPAEAEVTTSETTASTTYAALATAGPSIVIPRAGVYLVTVQATLSANALAEIHMSYDIGGTAAVDDDSAMAASSSATNRYAVVQTRKKTLTAVTLTAKYRTTAGTGTFLKRHLLVVPVRVS